MTRRSTRALWAPILLVVSLLAGCVSMPEPTRPSNLRTTVPTWTLPFGPSQTPAPDVTTATPGPETSSTPAEATAEPTSAIPGTITPTARPGIDPTLGAVGPDPSAELVTPIPEPMPQLFLDEGVYNILLLGRDTSRDSGTYRTDVMIVVSINKTANAVTMLTLPRDLFVYIPGWTMNRINTAAAHGDAIGYPGGGVALLEKVEVGLAAGAGELVLPADGGFEVEGGGAGLAGGADDVELGGGGLGGGGHGVCSFRADGLRVRRRGRVCVH